LLYSKCFLLFNFRFKENNHVSIRLIAQTRTQYFLYTFQNSISSDWINFITYVSPLLWVGKDVFKHICNSKNCLFCSVKPQITFSLLTLFKALFYHFYFVESFVESIIVVDLWLISAGMKNMRVRTLATILPLMTWRSNPGPDSSTLSTCLCQKRILNGACFKMA